MYGVFYVEKFTFINVVGCFLFQFQIMSSIGKWGGQLKTTKREIPDFMILELQGTKKVILISQINF